MKLYGHGLNPRGAQSLRDQIKSILEQEILAGRWKVGERLPTVRELAGEMGVSSSPIAQAMTSLVDEGYLIQRVGRGTFLRSTAPAAALQRSGVIGLVFTGAQCGMKVTASELFDRELMILAAQELSVQGFSTKVFHDSVLHGKGRRAEQLVATSPLRGIDGLLCMGPVGEHLLHHAQALNVPLVCLGDPYPPPGVAFVAGGIQQAVWEGLDILFNAGHDAIGLLHTVVGLPNRTRGLRYEAFWGACAELGIDPKPAWTVDVGPRYNVNISAVRDFLLLDERPSAILCTHNHAAQAIYEAAELLNVRIPEELSVLLITSAEDFGNDFAPPLSTLVIPLKPYAHHAVELLAGMLESGKTTSEGGHLIRPTRQERASVVRRSRATLPPRRGTLSAVSNH